MKKAKFIIKILICLVTIIIIYVPLSVVLKFNVVIMIGYFALWALILIYSLLDEYNELFQKKESVQKDLFNTYYINFSKVFEIAMLINNKIKTNIELSTKIEEMTKNSNKVSGSVGNKLFNINSEIGSEDSNIISNEYKEIQEVKNTNSIYLRYVLNYCKEISTFSNLNNGDLVKINDVKMQIVNNDEILQANSLISGVLNGNTLSTNSDGQMLNLNLNSLTNMILKDYKYFLKCYVSNTEQKFYIAIPMKVEKEFENDYSIYDLEIATVNVVGIYRTAKYNIKNQTTLSKLQELGSNVSVDEEEIKSSSNKKSKNNDDSTEGAYIDIIAIIQDLSFRDKEKSGEKYE